MTEKETCARCESRAGSFLWGHSSGVFHGRPYRAFNLFFTVFGLGGFNLMTVIISRKPQSCAGFQNIWDFRMSF